ncbi:MFS transporter [Saccharothrix sp. ALI-22-I]|uniref:MFS transporter n=1 Tax=Saccharothrix sp. ALI-22-I TaxID=1933778 RepID=UPI00097C07B2|nr:MFS transporter [Saccharothrix sp. ALI-22-I]ONI90033.1 MFS transporter [Saccharothrix sp. ALI-22-I]
MAPPLGPDFTKLWLASAVSNVGDGMAMAAGPLLLASLTDDPALVAGAVFAQQLPWLLFSLLSGVIVDRFDRRKLAVAANLGRGAIVAALAVAVWTGHASVPVVYACLFLLGVGETVADNAASALLPAVVSKEHLPRANSRLMGTHILGGSLAAPPIGAALFVVAAALPFGLDAASFVVAALLIATLRGVPKQALAEKRTLRADIGAGLTWLWRHEVLRTLALCLCLMNITFTGAMSILVLYSTERLGLDPKWFGLLLSTMAVGGVLGTLVSTRLIERFGPTALLRIGLVIEAGTHVALALAPNVWVAGVTLAVFGVHAVVWNVITHSVRQREVPDELRGRVGSAFFLLSTGGSALGALVGGVLARQFGITAPFWLGVVVVAGVTVVAWRPFAAATRLHRQAAAAT